MTEKVDRIYTQVTSVIEALEGMSPKEREKSPTKTFLDRYSQHRKLAMNAMTNIEENEWPPNVTDPRRANYVEILSYYKDMSALLSEGVSTPSAGLMG